jgi:hypothetical protein
MAPRWVIEIEHAGGTKTIESNHMFDIRMNRSVNAAGVVQYSDVYLGIRAQVRKATPSEVADEFKVMYDLAALQFQPATFRFKLDGVEKFVWTPATSVAGPTILNFEPEEADGNAGSRWVYRMDIMVRLAGGEFAGLHDLHTELTTTIDENGKTTLKVWRAVGKASSISKARSGVMRFKPKGAVREVQQVSFDPEPTFAATWSWEPAHRSAVTEDFLIVGGKDWWEISPQAGERVKPVLHLARQDAQIMRVDGIVRGLKGEKIAAPKPHWKESKDITRQEGLEPQGQFPLVMSEEDARLGIESLKFCEIYVNTGKTLPPPNHSDHEGTKSDEKVPADGAMANR